MDSNTNDQWILSVCKNEFLMKSKLTFHEAALDQIKTGLSKYLAPIVYWLEHDGVINILASSEEN